MKGVVKTMLLHFKEYESQNANYSRLLSHYDELPIMLHEMSAEDLIKEMNRNGVKSFYPQKAAVGNYLLWLSKNYDINVTDLYFELYQNNNKETFKFVGFFDFQDLQKGIIDAELTIEANSTANRDYDGLLCAFYLEWLGVSSDSFLSIRLEDVTELGKKVYIPAEDRTIEIDNDTIADFIWNYKNTTGRKRIESQKNITNYKQNTLYRTTKGDGINKKTIYNARNNFVSESGDKRFSKKRIYDSGRFYALYQEEIKCNQEFKMYNQKSKTNEEIRQIIRSVYNKPDMSNELITTCLRSYNVYKREYLKNKQPQSC